MISEFWVRQRGCYSWYRRCCDDYLSSGCRHRMKTLGGAHSGPRAKSLNVWSGFTFSLADAEWSSHHLHLGLWCSLGMPLCGAVVTFETQVAISLIRPSRTLASIQRYILTYLVQISWKISHCDCPTPVYPCLWPLKAQELGYLGLQHSWVLTWRSKVLVAGTEATMCDYEQKWGILQQQPSPLRRSVCSFDRTFGFSSSLKSPVKAMKPQRVHPPQQLHSDRNSWVVECKKAAMWY